MQIESILAGNFVTRQYWYATRQQKIWKFSWTRAPNEKIVRRAKYIYFNCVYSLRPKINAILEFEFCPTKNETLTNLSQKTRGSRSFSYKRQANI
jgi:hypothetical protein